MQNGPRAVAWHKTKRGLGAEENASFVSAAIHTVWRRGRERAQREWSQISSAKWSECPGHLHKTQPLSLLSFPLLVQSVEIKTHLKVESMVFSCRYLFLNWIEWLSLCTNHVLNERLMSIECSSAFRCKVLDDECSIPYLQYVHQRDLTSFNIALKVIFQSFTATFRLFVAFLFKFESCCLDFVMSTTVTVLFIVKFLPKWITKCLRKLELQDINSDK